MLRVSQDFCPDFCQEYNSKKDESAAAFKKALGMLQEYLKAESERYRKLKEVAAENWC